MEIILEMVYRYTTNMHPRGELDALLLNSKLTINFEAWLGSIFSAFGYTPLSPFPSSQSR